MNRIEAIFGMEPLREGEYPTSYTVGFDGVTTIQESKTKYGDHAIGHFDVFKGDHLHCQMMHRAVAEIHYFDQESES